jgi:HEPN domain-containing protein
MSPPRLIANYLRIAGEDLAAARLLEAAGNRNAAYLCEQAAEKVIRALLTAEGIHGGIGHALSQMVALLPSEHPWKGDLLALTPLAAFATTYRYPTSARVPPAPPAALLKELIGKVDHMLKRACSHFGVDPSGPEAPAANVTPPREALTPTGHGE